MEAIVIQILEKEDAYFYLVECPICHRVGWLSDYGSHYGYYNEITNIRHELIPCTQDYHCTHVMHSTSPDGNSVVMAEENIG